MENCEIRPLHERNHFSSRTPKIQPSPDASITEHARNRIKTQKEEEEEEKEGEKEGEKEALRRTGDSKGLEL